MKVETDAVLVVFWRWERDGAKVTSTGSMCKRRQQGRCDVQL